MITDEDRTYFAEGQCHALALAVGDLLPDAEYIAVWLDPRGEAALEEIDIHNPIERDYTPDPATVEHIMVLQGQDVIDISGRTSMGAMDLYCFEAIIGFIDVNMPLVRYAVVDRSWVESLTEVWRTPDLDAARRVAPLVLTLTNQEYA